MKKKIILIVAIILAFLLFFFLGYTFTSKNISKKENNTSNKNNMENSSSELNSNTSNGSENKAEEKVEKVQLNSKIGYEVLKNFEVTNLYSTEFYKLLDNENLSAKVKSSLALINIMQGKSYIHMLEFSDEDGSTYISKENMQSVINEIFYNSKDVFSEELIYGFKFDIEKGKYVIPSIGISGDTSKIVVEVPYEILEKGNTYEVYMYRLYIAQKFENVENSSDDISLKIKNEVYYNENMALKACDIYDNEMSGELSMQRDTLRKYIDEGKIDTNLSYKVKYTLLKDGLNYKINSYERI